MAQLTDEQARLFLDKNYGWATTIREDGTPHSTVVWIDYVDGDVVFNTAKPRAKWRHLERDPRCTVSVFPPDDPYRYVSVTGPVTLDFEHGNEHIDKMERKYRGNDTYQSHKEGETRVVVRVTPEVVSSSI
jgi:PPOX class probable F420-dependent enzyme